MGKSELRSKGNRRVLRGYQNESQACPLEPFRVEPHDFEFDPRLDLDKLNQVADELSDLAFLKKLGK
jgi:hypothetical protein